MSTLKVATIQATTANTAPIFANSVGTEIGTLCRAWVNFNGQGNVAIRSAFNVSTITDTGVGTYTANFTNPMPDANYSAQVTNEASTNNGGAWVTGYAVEGANIRTIATSASYDSLSVSLAIFR